MNSKEQALNSMEAGQEFIKAIDARSEDDVKKLIASGILKNLDLENQAYINRASQLGDLSMIKLLESFGFESGGQALSNALSAQNSFELVKHLLTPDKKWLDMKHVNFSKDISNYLDNLVDDDDAPSYLPIEFFQSLKYIIDCDGESLFNSRVIQELIYYNALSVIDYLIEKSRPSEEFYQNIFSAAIFENKQSAIKHYLKSEEANNALDSLLNSLEAQELKDNVALNITRQYQIEHSKEIINQSLPQSLNLPKPFVKI